MKVHAIQTGVVRVHNRQRTGKGHGFGRFVNTLVDSTWTEWMPIYAWVIEHPEGVIVVDTGETARTATPGYFPAWQPYFRFALKLDVHPEQEIGPQLRTRGIGPNDVRWVVMTHMHTDHAGGLAHFPKSEILISREELRSARGTIGKVRGYLPHRWPEWFAPRELAFVPEPLGAFPESYSVTRAGDVRVVRTFGHSAGHVSVVVEEEDGTLLFLAGDTSYTQQNLVAGVLDGVCSMGGGEAAEAESLARIQKLAAERKVVYLPTHDSESAARLEERRALPTSSPSRAENPAPDRARAPNASAHPQKSSRPPSPPPLARSRD